MMNGSKTFSCIHKIMNENLQGIWACVRTDFVSCQTWSKVDWSNGHVQVITMATKKISNHRDSNTLSFHAQCMEDKVGNNGEIWSTRRTQICALATNQILNNRGTNALSLLVSRRIEVEQQSENRANHSAWIPHFYEFGLPQPFANSAHCQEMLGDA